jgi:hypothetical protein
MDIMTGISAATKALEALKAIKDINKSFDAATWKAKVAELMSDIADMKVALIDANDKIRNLEKHNDELIEKVKFKAGKTKYEHGLEYEVFEDGTTAELPFCQHCMTTGKYVRIVRTPTGVSAICPGCKTSYDLRSVIYRPSPSPQSPSP